MVCLWSKSVQSYGILVKWREIVSKRQKKALDLCENENKLRFCCMCEKNCIFAAAKQPPHII